MTRLHHKSKPSSYTLGVKDAEIIDENEATTPQKTRTTTRITKKPQVQQAQHLLKFSNMAQTWSRLPAVQLRWHPL